MAEVRAKKALGQHFLTDLSIARRIADAFMTDSPESRESLDYNAGVAGKMAAEAKNEAGKYDVLEIGPGMGVLTQYMLQREDISLKMVEIDRESVDYLLMNFPKVNGSLIEADFLKMPLHRFFGDKFCIIGNFPYNISSQIFF